MSRLVVSDIDGTISTESGTPIESVIAYLRSEDAEGLSVFIVSGRSIDRLEETRAWLEANDVPHAAVHLNDFDGTGPNSSREFKLYKAGKLREEGHEIIHWIDDDPETRAALRELDIDALAPSEVEIEEEDDEEDDETPESAAKFDAPEWMQANAARGLEWVREGYGGDGLVDRTLREARQMANGFVSEDKAIRMNAWFARHMQDIDGVDARQDPPTPGMVAHALWGGWPRSESERAQAWAAERAERVRDQRSNGTNQQEETVMEFKTYTAEIKNAPEAGTVEAVVSVFNNIDYAGDRVVPGAFSKSLASYESAGKAIPFVWSHDYDTPESYIGKVVEAEETVEGLRVKAELFDTPRAQVVRELLTNRVVTEFSFAYEIVDQEKAADGANELKELRILECGPTLRGANPLTRLVDAKNAAIENAAAELHEAKAGRTLSSKNEAALSAAADLIEQAAAAVKEVLSSVQASQEPQEAKAEDPETVQVKGKAEERWDPKVALALIQLAELD